MDNDHKETCIESESMYPDSNTEIILSNRTDAHKSGVLPGSAIMSIVEENLELNDGPSINYENETKIGFDTNELYENNGEESHSHSKNDDQEQNDSNNIDPNNFDPNNVVIKTPIKHSVI